MQSPRPYALRGPAGARGEGHRPWVVGPDRLVNHASQGRGLGLLLPCRSSNRTPTLARCPLPPRWGARGDQTSLVPYRGDGLR